MSEIKLNLTDARHTLNGTIHCSIADACVAALSAEPETISELEAALTRFINPVDDSSPFAWFRRTGEIDKQPWDAGIAIIDLAARIVASNSTYSQPGPQGEVRYHDGVSATDIPVLYRLPDDWLFLNSIEEYECLRQRRRQERAASSLLDTRAVLYGRPLLEWAVSAVYHTERAALESAVGRQALQTDSPVSEATFAGSAGMLDASAAAQTSVCNPLVPSPNYKIATNRKEVGSSESDSLDQDDALRNEISSLHARWLMTPRDDLQGQSPRDVLLAKQDFIDFDLHTRSLQWSLQGEGPPCLATDSFAYRFAGFGTHEWVVYYDLVRHLLWSAVACQRACPADPMPQTEYLQLLARLEQLKRVWLEQPGEDFGGKIPALIVENERIRLPIAMRGHDMVIDDDCPVCQMMGDDTGLGMEVSFWHLDGSHMDEDFAFSSYKTRAEWEAESLRREEFNREFNRRWEERQQRIARGEVLEPDPFFDPDPYPGLEFGLPSLVSGESTEDDEKEFPQ
jgi:hypothetical protein